MNNTIEYAWVVFSICTSGVCIAIPIIRVWQFIQEYRRFTSHLGRHKSSANNIHTFNRNKLMKTGRK